MHCQIARGSTAKGKGGKKYSSPHRLDAYKGNLGKATRSPPSKPKAGNEGSDPRLTSAERHRLGEQTGSWTPRAPMPQPLGCGDGSHCRLHRPCLRPAGGPQQHAGYSPGHMEWWRTSASCHDSLRGIPDAAGAGDPHQAAKERESAEQSEQSLARTTPPPPKFYNLEGRVGVALMSWRAWTPYLTRVMIPGETAAFRPTPVPSLPGNDALLVSPISATPSALGPQGLYPYLTLRGPYL
ncbi:hypothetical protein QTO34_018323 [Cnephaeus nilssonii]|uniref:Uncharacterized protein n=1 Tax=Cnephaeus nilssonii TaxID=3371016 RepID=A0AA40LQ29_CNENI|nr:hypothetical protein QTO34_018323 [Eptesicus nilssonii]